MTARHTPGPWTLVNHTVMTGTLGSPTYQRIAQCTDRGSETEANARLIAAAPTMHKKLADTVAWLDREIETWEGLVTKESAQMLFKLTELRDDLAETLRRIEE